MTSGRPSGHTGMGTMIDIRGARTWYAAHGSGEPLVYLHGGFSDARELDRALDAYTAHFRVFTPERRGHGRTPDVDGAYSFPGFAADMVAFLEEVVGGPANLLGYSDGATTALHVALERPDLVRRLVLISGQFHVDGLQGGFLDGPDVVAELVASPLAAAYGELSPDGADHFPVVAGKIVELARTGPTLAAEQLAGVAARTLVVSGDDDIVRLEHTLQLFRGIPDSELAVVPGTSHLLVEEKPELVTRLVVDFLTTDPVPTIAPIRRAQATGGPA
jgi:pimeloyl-ACP methyl ester carboxylesterase